MAIRSQSFQRFRKRITAFNVAAALFTVFFVIFFVFPLYWQVATSLKTRENTLRIPPQLIPNPVNLDRYVWVFKNTGFPLNVRNSLITAGLTTITCVLISTLASYALARLKLRGSRAIMMSVLICSMLPAVAIVGPLYLTFRRFHLLNSFTGLIISYTAFFLPFTMWFLTSFFKTIPPGLEEAAAVDGCSPCQTLFRIIIPISMPAIFTVGMMVFIFSWNEFLFAFTFTSIDSVRTYPVGLVMFQGQWEVPWAELCAASTIVVIPIIILVLAAQRFIIRGLTAGAVKE
ncbi:MAG: carbohydrate ABC transporter permease [Kiritimatiellia bacterium]|jgi:multiple sugar transport system permease protein|nr:carbohydrate ABC transporter permease [Kiritimatiellia bacterium]